MGWEDRNGKRYYYRKRREGRHVISEYIGCGFVGELAEDMDIIDRAESHQAREVWQATKQSADAIASQARQVTSAALALGFLSLASSPFASITSLGLLSAIAILGATLADLLVLPALIAAMATSQTQISTLRRLRRSDAF